MKEFRGRLAVITGGGTGWGRALARQLAAEGCHLALCDVSEEAMVQTRALCETEGPEGLRVSTTLADVSDESAVLAFRDAVAREHETDHIHLLFNNAGIGGAGSFIVRAQRSHVSADSTREHPSSLSTAGGSGWAARSHGSAGIRPGFASDWGRSGRVRSPARR